MPEPKPFSDEQIKNMVEFCKPYKVSEDTPPYALKGMLQKAYDDEQRFLSTIAARDTELNAWKTTFGNQQLTHAVAQRTADRKRIEELEGRDSKRINYWKALRKIGAYGDKAADIHLKKTSSYSHFDEPSSVQIARETLAEPERSPKEGESDE